MLTSKRRRLRIVAALAAGSVGVGTVLTAGVPAFAGTSASVTITALSPKIVASATKSQVITVTGTGFDETTIAGVTIDKCSTAPTYIVVSATSMVLKTAGTDCATGAAIITITDADGDTAVSSNAGNQVLTFAAPPAIVAIDGSNRPLLNETTASLPYADQTVTSPIEGGTVVRVVAASGTPFANSTALPLKASLGGTAMTEVKMATDGSYFTAKAPKHAVGTVGLQVTSAGVSKTFSATDTGYSYAGTLVTVSPQSGPAAGGTTVSISGTGFIVTGTGSSVVKFGTVAATVDTAKSTATKLVVAAPAQATGATEGPVSVSVSTGSTPLNSIITGATTYTYVSH
ncbi:IPT/TIG domain-containing protein [Cryptosporangium sp. NPDC051539]|uniref:IPT/TIG domain-containing protein n=1 Tax=Cryptosporangium sp. NPDC051539 TaxID=3363962 RepID=UPI003795FBFA